jgi:hypothetical protein
MYHIRWPIIALATVIGTKAATATFCSDLQSALAQSGNFAKLRGTATDEKTWQTTIGITGANSCSISSASDRGYILSCIMLTRSSKETEANQVFSSLIAQVKGCLPPPKFSYRTKELDSPSGGLTEHFTNFIIDSNHKTKAYVTLLRVGDLFSFGEPIYDLHTGKQTGTLRTGFQYWIALVVVEQ